MSSVDTASRTGYAEPARRRTSAMNGRPIRARTSPDNVMQMRPPASFRGVRTAAGGRNSLDMARSVASLPDQLSTGLRVGSASQVPLGDAERIFVVGMGGSAIGADVFAAWVADRSKVAMQVVRDYRLPSYARPDDLVVAISYLGNTEETLGATAEGLKLGCRVVAITSGGM